MRERESSVSLKVMSEENLPVPRVSRLVSSASNAQRYFVPGESDPLHFLRPWEQRTAELYVEMSVGPADETRRSGRISLEEFGEVFRQEFGAEYNIAIRAGLHSNPAWKAYVQQLRDDARGVALKKLKNRASKAVDTYLWAQDRARESDDYKEARVAAGDHLDRIGATEKPNVQPVQAIQIVVKSRNVDLANPFKELPAVEVVEDDSKVP